MASLANDPGGKRRILVMIDGRRKPIRLGKIPKKQAEGVLRHVEALAAARVDGSAPPAQTSAWLASVSETLRGRLAAIGLAGDARPALTLTVAELAKRFGDQKYARLKPRTVANYSRSFAVFADHVGGETLVADVTQGDAEAFRDALLNDGYAEATVRRRCADAAILMGHAVKHRIIDRNPFVDAGDAVPRKIRGTKRTADVTRETFAKALACEPDAELRVAYCLSRYGGLRVPSEIRELRWSDVDWGRQRFRVTAPKTERYEGQGERIVPIFPELAEPLEALYVATADPDGFVLPSLVDRPDNYVGRRLGSAIKRAGVEKWPRRMHNMRATRQTELEQDYPTHVVCAWLGNSPEVARETYLRVRESDFEQATSAAQNAAQSAPANARSTSQAATTVSTPIA